jgi:transposase
MGGHKPRKISGEHHDWLVKRCRAADFTLRGLVAELAGRGLKVDYHSVWDFVHAEKLSLKKTLHASEQDRPAVARRRAQWRRYQTRIDPTRLVFIDETRT